MKNEEISKPVSLPEEVFDGDYLIATYFFRTSDDIDVYEKSKSFAIGQSIGTWIPVPGITSEMRKSHSGRIVAIYDIPPAELIPDIPEETSHIIQIAFPDNNFNPQFPMLITTLLGNDISTSAQVKLIDLKFSKKFLKAFPGPKFGIDGLYDYFNFKIRDLLY